MRKRLGAAAIAAILSIGGGACAADLPGGSMKDTGIFAPANTWAGFYFGLHAGAAWAEDGIRDLDDLNGGASYALDNTAVTGGAQVGYNLQSGNFVYGLEVDVGGVGLGGRKFDPNFIGGTYSGLDGGVLGDVTARLGMSFGATLAYVKGGYAFFTGDAYVDNFAGFFGGGRANTGSYDGWTIGAGLEHALSPLVSVKVEYQYFDFGTLNATLQTPEFGNFRYSNDLTVNTVTVGINLHLNGAEYAPLK
jgi:outer membrane immunogenic protein